MELGGKAADGRVVTPADHALDQFVTGLDHLVKVVKVVEDGGLGHYGNADLVGFMQAFERVRNRMPLVDHRIVAEGESRGLADALTQPSMTRVLVSALRLSSGEANRRVRAAEAVGVRVSMVGEALAPARPTLAAAQRAGEVSPEQVHLIQRAALAGVDRPGFDPADIDLGEQLLTAQAAVFEPKILAQLADQVVAAIDPDGTLPDDRLNADRRHFTMRPTQDGAYTGEFRLTGTLGAKLCAILRPLAKPRTEKLPRPDDAAGSHTAAGAGSAAGAAGSTVFGVDERTYGQRMHDAMEDVADRLLRCGDLPDSGGTPATVIITITLEDLLDRFGHGRTSDATLIPTAQVLKLAAEADLIPTVINRAGAVLDQGRARRVATTTQTWALYARDRGCSFPGCDQPPEMCERHHLIAWIDGGPTNLNNLTLLCRYHHHNFTSRGWTGTINPDGLPQWTPPSWIDREQRPMINNRIRLAQLSRSKRFRQ